MAPWFQVNSLNQPGPIPPSQVKPTTKLVHETINRTLPDAQVTANVTAITSQTHPWKVFEALDRHLKAAVDGEGEILVITHSAFFGLPYFHNPQGWIVIIDEIPAVERSFSPNIPDSHELLTRHIEVSDKTNPEYWAITAKDESAIRKIARNKRGDVVYEHFREFADTLLSPQWATFVNAQNYARLVDEKDVDGVSRQLVASAIMSPTVFAPYRRVIIAGACFKESILYMLWSAWENPNLDIRFEDWSEKFDLRYRQHNNGHLLDIFYGVDCPWSKNVRDKTVTLADGSEGNVFEAMQNKAREMVGSHGIATFANVDIKEKLFENCERLPNVSHGLNTYQTIDHAFLVSALNPPSPHFAFLKRYAKIESDAVQTALFRQAVYQAGNRTSIRDIANENRKMWFVPDSGTAYWLAGMYAGAQVHDLGLFASGQTISNGKAGRPRVHGDDASRQKAYRERKAHRDRVILERLIRLDVVNGLSYRNNPKNRLAAIEVIAGMTEEPNLKLSTISKTTFQGTFFTNNRAKVGDAFEGSFDDLVVLYRDFSNRKFETKDTLPALSPSHYVDNGSDTKRGYANIVFARNIILDFDGGDLTPDQFEAFFPGWRMLIHSSWSSTPLKPKWRVLIETDLVLDIDGYKVITGYIVSRLNDMGFWTQKELDQKPSRRGSKNFKGLHGIDVTKLNPACILYVPSKRSDSFFMDIPGDPIRVYDLMEQIGVPELEECPEPILIEQKPEHEPLPAGLTAKMKAMTEALRAQKDGEFSTRKATKVNAAQSRWDENDFSGRRDAGIWRLAVDLRNAGCDAQEALSIIEDAIRGARSPDKRGLRSKAKRAVKSLM